MAKAVHTAVYKPSLTSSILPQNTPVVLLFYHKDTQPNRDEVEMLSLRHGHPNLVRFAGVVTGWPNDERVCLLQERAAHGDAVSFFLGCEDNNVDISILHRLTMAKQVAAGMQALHALDYSHCDLAARNVLVYAFAADDPHQTLVKVTDFGLVHKQSEYYVTEAGVAAKPVPLEWMAPEAVESPERRYSEAANV